MDMAAFHRPSSDWLMELDREARVAVAAASAVAVAVPGTADGRTPQQPEINKKDSNT